MPDVAIDLAARLQRVRSAMGERGLDGLLVYGTGQHNMLRMDQVRYLTDLRVLGPHATLLVPAAGPMRLIVTPRWDAARAKEIAPMADVEALDAPDLPSHAARHAREMLGRRVGVSGRDAMPAGFAAALFGALGDVTEVTDLVPGMSATRTPLEIARLRRAAVIADAGFDALQQTVRVGMREYELHAEIEAAMRSLGSEDNFGLLAAGAHNVAIRPSTERRLERGDAIVGEITPSFEGQFAQLCRTFILGTPTDAQRKGFDLLLDAYRRGLAAAVPGATNGEVVAAVNAPFEAAGFGEFCRQPYMRTRGHGLGSGAVVPQEFAPGGKVAIRAGMTFVIHPNQYLPDPGYLMLGDTVLITERGAEPLTKTPLRLHTSED